MNDDRPVLTRRDFLAAGGLAAGGLLLGDRSPPARGAPGRGSTARSRAPGPATAEVRMRRASSGAQVWFEPVGIRVEPGDTVRWVVDRGVHTATAYHPENGGRPLRMPREAEPWDSGYLAEPDRAFEHTFRREGVYDYFCRPHEAAGMVGRIVVARPERADHRDLPGWSGGSREHVLSPQVGEDAGGPRLPRAARSAFPSVSRVLEEGAVTPKGAAPPAR